MAKINRPASAQINKPTSPRERLLKEAINITTSDRNAAYGKPEDNFANIAAYWSSYLTQSTKVDIVISPQDVAHMMILMKVARLATNPSHYDSLLDIAGYAACGEDCRFGAQGAAYNHAADMRSSMDGAGLSAAAMVAGFQNAAKQAR